ncbi:hypothetical protein L3V77_22730 [Vibrio sp. DW001]|uniref:hypothetical protein n=1 Tax=Vibrio sp. DW001 TaxID=2912315 RepID=UPI0023AE8639|nr:hypothetical protein [Vibrio sp. DW001]WED28756.1 hypothetical protein L3V77_22730 [Vibrio sp. DW001]
MSEINKQENELVEELQENDSSQPNQNGWDFVFSIVVVIFAAFIIVNSLTMPFSGTVGGVKTTWYESPGLLPLFIGFALLMAGISIFLSNKKEGGYSLFLKQLKFFNPTAFFISGGGLLSYIYILITWYDFFLGSMAFLLFYIALYYFDKPPLTKMLLKVYYGFMALSAIIFLSGMDAAINASYEFNTDIIMLILSVCLIYTMHRFAKQEPSEYRPKVRRVILIATIFPLILCPIFRYFLLVPLPKEGLVIEQVLNTTYFTYLADNTATKEVNLSNENQQLLDDAF